MIDRDALGEVDDCQFGPVLVHHQVELVVIAVNQPVLSKFHQSIEGSLENRFNLLLSGDPLNMAKGISVYQGHEDGVSVGIDGSRDGEPIFMQ